MLVRNKKLIFCTIFLCFFVFFNFSAKSEQFDISAAVITADKENEILDAEGSVTVLDQDGNVIKSNKARYFKKEEIIDAEDSVVVTNTRGNKITSDKIRYLKNEGEIISYENSKVYMNNGYEVTSDNLVYDTINEIVKSNEYSNLIDLQGNSLTVEMFEYSIIKEVFASKGYIQFIDNIKNKHFFDEVYIDTKNNKLVGSNVKVDIDRKNISEANKNNEPRFVANTAIITNDKSYYKKGVYTLCRKRGNDKCPPWVLQAKNITHDKKKKMIYYDHSVLKIYDKPVFYFPKFFHPDPSVKRQSGFLQPTASDSDTMGLGVSLPYFWAISDSKDMTLTPKTYLEDNPLLLTEYRQVTQNSDLVLDLGYTQGYSDPSNKQTPGSRNHIFVKSNIDMEIGTMDQSDIYINLQKASNDTYFRIHDINTATEEGGTGLVKATDTSLENEIRVSLKKDDFFMDVKMNAYEDLTNATNSRYEFITPDITIGNKLFTSETLGNFNWQSRSYYKNYSVDKHTSLLVNDINWSSNQKINSKGIVTNFDGILKNTNYDADDAKYKSDGKNHEISGVIAMTSSLPMQKENDYHLKTLSPKVMLRYAPVHMRDLTNDGFTLSTTNLYSVNKSGQLDVIDFGQSAIIGVDFAIDRKTTDKETATINNLGNLYDKQLDLSIGQVLSLENNSDMPTQSSLEKKMSDIVGSLDYYFDSEKKIGYKFNLDNNLDTINSHDVSGKFDFGKISFNFDYLEQNNHTGSTNFAYGGLTYNFNENNSFNFETRKKFQTNSTEFYNINYQYINDCFRARVEFKRNFYSDRDLEPTDTVRITMAILPYYQYASGNLSNTGTNLRNIIQND